ncbi:helix-turn-helix transcriptional regulator [Bacillus sp. ISL-40]|uniref:AraC family transcriptional regulator n=1 Tax=unclassified Bacillus (in: firmicutes) TaxID=185979 RepID=UPI001BE6674C|nr:MULTISPECIES: AraC family transcriptional regulator [unclassified Bacillus (in: firmicutes)]MBT2699416.1 helix-turn-helix transcriptional regulator [Bacillus sp. ISL-40]MBT2719928.1 helix-turn-helix transcriptional regulator [Bacillus sp. ISL-46]MBT2728936.1 helix-turn-helix transcriptional regulator [Bacillus sp. ISL-75]MBT2742749.1 helix-turn-helix transcriptional regulator [Bacillus sp. ISL-77]
MSSKFGVYGFRFLDTLNSSFYQLFAVGHQHIKDTSYEWDGLKRKDGPLLLFQYTISGSGNIELDGVVHKLTEGSAFMVEIPSDHRYYLPQDSENWEFYFILFRPTNLQKEWTELIKLMGNVSQISELSSPITFLKNAYYAASKQQITDGFRASTIVYQFVMELYRYTAAYKKEKEIWPEKVIQAVHFLEEDYCTIQSLDVLALRVGLSKFHFTRLFKRTTGLSPMEYLTKVRMEKAVQLLRNTDMTIEETSKQIGYSNSSYFIKVFREWIGFSPGEFRLGKDLAFLNEFRFD